MKIYSKKRFALGSYLLLLGIIWFVAIGLDGEIEPMPIGTICLGLSELIVAFSRKRSQKAELDEKDERNQYVDMKAQSKAFEIMNIGAFILMLVSAIAVKITGNEEWYYLFCGAGAVTIVSLFVLAGTWYYYNKKV